MKYVVMGSTGEYSEKTQSAVVYFDEVVDAESRVTFEACEKTKNFWACSRDAKHSMDPDFKMDYTGTSYYIHEVPKGELPPVVA